MTQMPIYDGPFGQRYSPRDFIDVSKDFSRSMIPPVVIPKRSLAKHKTPDYLHNPILFPVEKKEKATEHEIFILLPTPARDYFKEIREENERRTSERINSALDLSFLKEKPKRDSFLLYPTSSSSDGGSSSSDDTPEDLRSTREKLHDALNCYLTTACIQTRGLPDDCFELTTLRRFRNEVMATRLEGRVDIEEYKRIAPEIVRRLNLKPDSREIYSEIYHQTIQPAVRLVQSGDFQKAYNTYKSGVLELKVLTEV